MRRSVVRDRLKNGEVVINAWLSIGSSYAAEGIGHSGVHSVTVDLQHGMLDFTDALAMLQAISATPATPLVRVPSLDPAKIMHLLDAGAYGIICPMISTPQDAAELVAACRYPPTGKRSFGPSRGLLFGGDDYVAHANETILVIPMIETAEGVKQIDAILDVDGIDMVYLGPNDMAFALEGRVELPRPNTEAALAQILKAATQRDIPAGIFCASADDAQRRIAEGFQLVTPANDFAHLTRSMKSAVNALTNGTGGGSSRMTAKHGY